MTQPRPAQPRPAQPRPAQPRRALPRTTAALAVLGVSALALTGLAQLPADAGPAAAPGAAGTPTLAVVGELPAQAYDARRAQPALAPTADQRAAVARLRAATGATVTWNRTLGTPRTLAVPGGGALAPARSGEPLAVARGWLTEHADLLGLGAADVAALEVVRDHELPGGVATVLSFAQTYDGVASGYGAILTVVVDRDGRVVRYAGDSTRGTELHGAFEVSAAEALTGVVDRLAPGSGFEAVATGETQAGYQVFGAGPFADVQRVRRIAFPLADGGHAAYAVLFVKDQDSAWVEVVGADNGATLLRRSLVQHAEGTIYENYPGAPRGGKPVVKDFGPTKQSPGGWVDPSGMAGAPGPTTSGNNADTIAQWSAPLAPSDRVNRPVSPLAEFHYEFTDSWREGKGGPGTFAPDKDAAIVNLFYHHNRIHDEYYEFGFTETAGNFQVNNFGLGGEEGDPVLGQAQSGAVSGGAPTYVGRDNANMLTLPDGIAPLTSMYLWEPIDDAFEGPYRDGDFDATIIQHEYSHGLSNRYVGGGGLGSLGSVQAGSMGEGWGDWYAMNHLFREGLERSAVTAAYVGSRARGIRNWNYAHHPTTFGDIGYDVSGPEVHSDGEIWTATLWQLREEILRAVDGDQRRASDVTEHIVTDAMPISPAGPSMLDMRDAILEAAEIRYGDRYTDLIWSVFAQRGMGASARTKGETDTEPRPGFDAPADRLNGTLDLTLVNASAGNPVEGARVMVGELEARVSPLRRTDGDGSARAPMVAGGYTLTIQAPGYGIQQFPVRIERGQTTRETLRLRPNLLSEASGATVRKPSSQDRGMPAEFAFDDSESSAWRTAPDDEPYNDGKPASVVVELARQALVETIAVSVLKPPTIPRFASAEKVRVLTSLDGKDWETAEVASFANDEVRPTVATMKLRTYRLARPVAARFVKVVIEKSAGSNAKAGSTALVSEVQAFGEVAGLRPQAPPRDKPVTSAGSVAAGNISQGVLLLDGTEPYRHGATTGSWQATCPGLPPANGADAWVMKLPKGAADGQHVVTLKGSVPIGEFFVWYYDSTCTPIAGDFGYLEEPSLVPPAAAYAGMLLLYGGAAEFDMTVSEVR